MTGEIVFSKTPRTMTVRIPLSVRMRSGRRVVIAPQGPLVNSPRARVDAAIIKAIARAHRWRRQLESGQYGCVVELARAEQINQSYLCRVLRLTLLAPDIVEAILNGGQPEGLQITNLLNPFPCDWQSQRLAFGITSGSRRPVNPSENGS